MELSKENQDLLSGFPHFYAVDSNMPMLAKHHVEKILIQKQQKIEELEKEKLILQSMVDALNEKIDSLTEDKKQ
jgi:hypothetical protein